MEVGKVGYNTCKMFYNKLGNKNARTALGIIKSFGEQKIYPRVSRLGKDTMEIQFYQRHPDFYGDNSLITQVYDFARRVINQYSSCDYPFIGIKANKNSSDSRVVSFDDIGLK